MVQIGKASAKRSKPSYFMAILGVTIVLFFVGIFGWVLLIAQSLYRQVKRGSAGAGISAQQCAAKRY